MNVLIIGSGGREHAICWTIANSPKLTKLFAAPGNAGIAELAICLPISVEDNQAILRAVHDHSIDFVIIGPEVPLVNGLADLLQANGIAVFGPSKAAAQIEGSKGFMKDLCAKAGIPTARYARFTDIEKAKAYVEQYGAPIVIKADGLAAGKGVTVAMTSGEALAAIDTAMRDNAFGSAGASLVIEEFMEGEEASFFALADGETAIAFAHAQDHKRAFDGDKGPNTGGMGAYSPAPIITPALHDEIMQRIILPTAKQMVKDGTPFRGVLFAGLMLTKEKAGPVAPSLFITGAEASQYKIVPKLIEYNARFGDPETQAMLPRLKSDLLDVLHKTALGRLNEVKLEWHDCAALCVVMAAKGYPGAYQKNTVIKGLDKAADLPNVVVFHAGTINNDGAVLANGGRVLGITGFAPTLKEAQKDAYRAVDAIDWPEGFCRCDIGWRAL
ncbi:MAG: phosphoribosylamine--glycine ligase [Alphaproteobacteria bacterium]|nr:phosphoribosylamine--glycine ligase [Alphaproteobacteria bacterium]